MLCPYCRQTLTYPEYAYNDAVQRQNSNPVATTCCGYPITVSPSDNVIVTKLVTTSDTDAWGTKYSRESVRVVNPTIQDVGRRVAYDPVNPEDGEREEGTIKAIGSTLVHVIYDKDKPPLDTTGIATHPKDLCWLDLLPTPPTRASNDTKKLLDNYIQKNHANDIPKIVKMLEQLDRSYKTGDPIVSDADYDKLKRHLEIAKGYLTR